MSPPRSARPSAFARARARALAALSALALAGCDGGGGGVNPALDASIAPPPLRCDPLRIEPSPARVATNGALQLRVTGGSGAAVFGAEGELAGAVLEPGGGLRGGPRAATFTALARDGRCMSEARAEVQVVGPFDVRPLVTRVAPGGTVRYAVSGNIGAVRFAVLNRPVGAGTMGAVSAEGVFTAGSAQGSYDLVARDEASGQSLRLAVDVGAGTPLRPRAAVVLVPTGESAPLEFRGGSGTFDFAVTGAPGGRVLEPTPGRYVFDAAMARVGVADVAVTDRFTSERVTVRVLVGDALGAEPIARGTQTATGDLVSGDFNGDGRADLAVGHSERSATGLEAGGVLLYYGDERGGFPERPSLALEGPRARDRFGAVLLVRDVNGDGVDDLLVGSPEQDLGEADRGTVSLHLGSRAGLVEQPERVLLGEDSGHRFGSAMALADLDGDRALDLVVTAPGALNPTARTCQGGRAYVFRNRGGRGVFETIPWQSIDLRDALSDDPEAFVPCATNGLDAGRSVALFDFDNDGKLDLVVGAPRVSYGMAGANQSHGALEVHRGGDGGFFDRTPTWSLHLEAALRQSNVRFGEALDVVRAGPMGPAVLVARTSAFAPRDPMNASRTLSNAGGLWVFAQGTLPPPASMATGDAGAPAPRIRTVTTEIARGRYYGAASNRGVGRHATLADLDGDGADEYVVSASSSGAPGSVQWFSLAAITSPSATLAPAGEASYAVMGMPAPPNELQGYRIARLPGALGQGAGLALWAPWRTTMQGPFIGAVDLVAPGAGGLASRFGTRASVLLQGFGASDRAGSTVALGALSARGAVEALVGAPGSHSPAVTTGMTPRLAGERLRTGAVDVFAAGATASSARAFLDRQDAQLGGSPVVVLDFDGDGVDEVAVADPAETQGTMLPAGTVNPDECGAVTAAGALAQVSSRGSVRIYALRGGALVERWRAVSRRETPAGMSGTTATYRLNRFGAALAVADVNGDGRDDLVVGRSGSSDGTGAEVVLGRVYDDAMNRVVFACNDGAAHAVPPSSPTDATVYGTAVAGVGDLDRDGCDETAYAITRNGSVGSLARAGVLLRFGYGERCMGHTSPFELRIVADDRALDDNAPGSSASRDNDDGDVPGLPGSMGRVLAAGSGDFTGDGVPDLVYRTQDLGFRGTRGAAVEVLSGAFLAGLCPERRCPSGRRGAFFADGEYRVLGVRGLDEDARRVLPAPVPIAVRFGSALALAELSGDASAELVVGAADDPTAGPFAGMLRAFRGGAATSTQDALLQGDAWLVAVGDPAERGEFGAAVAARSRASGAPGWLLIGAPSSSRHRRGGEIGAAFRWRVEVP